MQLPEQLPGDHKPNRDALGFPEEKQEQTEGDVSENVSAR